ncbi:hypothetical protein C8R44DRAFT_893988 [Mycena epipterygia]|nr:hypothetical protein C8R44DRAFT_893988 [Mycena epipterygia]
MESGAAYQFSTPKANPSASASATGNTEAVGEAEEHGDNVTKPVASVRGRRDASAQLVSCAPGSRPPGAPALHRSGPRRPGVRGVVWRHIGVRLRHISATCFGPNGRHLTVRIQSSALNLPVPASPKAKAGIDEGSEPCALAGHAELVEARGLEGAELGRRLDIRVLAGNSPRMKEAIVTKSWMKQEAPECTATA